jgi:hypothetical protein
MRPLSVFAAVLGHCQGLVHFHRRFGNNSFESLSAGDRAISEQQARNSPSDNKKLS